MVGLLLDRLLIDERVDRPAREALSSATGFVVDNVADYIRLLSDQGLLDHDIVCLHDYEVSHV